MNKKFNPINALLATLVAFATGCGASTAPNTSMFRPAAGSNAASKAYSNRMIVKFRSGASNTQIQSLTSRLGVNLSSSIPQLGIRVFSASKSRPFSSQLEALSANPIVEYAEPDYQLSCKITSNDTETSEQWGNRKINLPRAWDYTMGDSRVIVAVVDTGVDLTHPDLQGRLAAGRSFVPGSTGPMDDNGHGTHVAGIIAAEANNNQGIAGVAPKCRIMPVKVLDADGKGGTSDIVTGILWAVDHGAKVINLSLGGGTGSKALEGAVQYVIKRNAVVVAAMGNDGENAQEYPASYQGVIAVGASDSEDGIAGFSNTGNWISVSAPGDGIYSTTPTYSCTLSREEGLGQSYGTLSGTSMATPYVAGLAALILSVYPNATPSLVKSKIERACQDIESSGFDAKSGFGRVDAGKLFAL